MTNNLFESYLFSICLLYSVQGCNLQSHQLRDFNHTYKKEKTFFDYKYVDHFPDQIIRLTAKYEYSENISRSHPHLWFKTSNTADVINSLEKKIEDEVIAI